MITSKSLYKFVTLLVAGVLIASCSKDDSVFNESAATRIANAVAQDKAILESATNGWQMVLWTGEGYSGGGYNMFLKFKDGKVTTQSDIAPSSKSYHSSYDITKDQGPVLTFNTYNDVMHYMAEPSASALSGNEGDYEFVIQRATQDSVFLKGKKYGNKTVMTRIPDGMDVAATIDKMQSNVKSVAGYFTRDALTMNYNDGDQYYSTSNDSIIIDPSERRLYPDSRNMNVSLPYVATTTGIKCVGIDAPFTWDASTQTLNYQGIALENVHPEGYNPIDNWVGTWGVRYIGSHYNESTGTYVMQYDTLKIQLDYETDLIEQKAAGALKGTFNVQGYDFNLIVYYSPITGRISIPAQYIADPTGTYDLFLLLGTNADQWIEGTYAWYAVSWNVEWQATESRYKLIGEKSNGLEMDVLQILAVNSSGSIIADSSGSPIALVSLTYPDYFIRIEK